VQPLLQWKSNKYSTTVFAFVALGIQYAMRMRHIYHLWPAPLSNIFPQVLINGTICVKKGTEHKMCVSCFSTIFVRNIFNSKKK
jgi:hypothetical protein